MADKKITDLTLIDSIAGTESFPVDDTIQTYRATPSQMKSYVLSDGSINLAMLADSLKEALCPVGTIQAYSAETAPDGWLVCDGSAVSRTTYATLFALVGSSFGQGDGSTTFNLPDLRGRFLRGWANGSALDPDADARTAMNTGGNTADNIGSVQGHAFQTHTHIQNAHSHEQQAVNNDGAAGSARPAWGASVNTTPSATANTTATNQNASATGTNAQATTDETRPVNASVNFIIKT